MAVHISYKRGGKCACGYAGLGAEITADPEQVTCGMCKRVIRGLENPPKPRRGRHVKKRLEVGSNA